MNLEKLTVAQFVAARENSTLEAEGNYQLTDALAGDASFAHSPDGEGVYWFDTFEEWNADHGTTEFDNYADDIYND